MKERALSIDEASALRNEYCDLVGQLFCREYPNLGKIVDIAICPFGKLDNYYFLQQYKTHRDAKAAMSFYTCDEFDVVALALDGSGEPVCRELRAHVAYISAHPDVTIRLD